MSFKGLLKSIKTDIETNIKSGVLLCLFLVGYRLGRFCLLKRSRNKLYWVPYIACWAQNRLLSLVFGCSVPFSCSLGSTLRFPHGIYGVFISGRAVIDDGCTIFHNVTIGGNYGSKKAYGAPYIGKNVLIGANAVVIGPVKLEDGVFVRAGDSIFQNVSSK